MYVGETGWSLDVRLKEHKYAVKQGTQKMVHAQSNEHQVDWDVAKVTAFEQY